MYLIFLLVQFIAFFFFFFSSRRRHTRSLRDWSSDVCSSDLSTGARDGAVGAATAAAAAHALLAGEGVVAGARRTRALHALLARERIVARARSEERRVGKECRCGGWAGR